MTKDRNDIEGGSVKEKCETCGTELSVYGCLQCGAPVCCPRCCDEATKELIKELKPCPFCSCEKIEIDTEPDSEGWCYLWCSSCLVAYSIHEPREDTIKRWNTRPPQTKEVNREMLINFGALIMSCLVPGFDLPLTTNDTEWFNRKLDSFLQPEEERQP